jgi:hypothetical protein
MSKAMEHNEWKQRIQLVGTLEGVKFHGVRMSATLVQAEVRARTPIRFDVDTALRPTIDGGMQPVSLPAGRIYELLREGAYVMAKAWEMPGAWGVPELVLDSITIALGGGAKECLGAFVWGDELAEEAWNAQFLMDEAEHEPVQSK